MAVAVDLEEAVGEEGEGVAVGKERESGVFMVLGGLRYT